MIRAIAITGPTASGKTAISLALATALGAEIISSDSMQIYRGMDIGTAKATAEERAVAPHHLLDIIGPSEIYSAEDYRRDALLAASDIHSRGKIPLFVGGTGLYIDTVMRGAAAASPPSDPVLRERLMKEAEEGGAARLWQRLFEVDPESAEKTHENNVRRVVRALEIYELTGNTKSYYDRLSREAASDISMLMITLDFHNRDTLYRRVDARVDAMMAEGLLQEVSVLYRDGLLKSEYTAAQAIGYKELVAYLEGKATLAEAVNMIKLSSRRYAKRQLTWFRHEKDAVRVFVDGEDGNIKNKDELIREVVRIAETYLKG